MTPAATTREPFDFNVDDRAHLPTNSLPCLLRSSPVTPGLNQNLSYRRLQRPPCQIGDVGPGHAVTSSALFGNLTNSAEPPPVENVGERDAAV